MKPKLNAISAAVVIALAAASTAHAALERVGPVDNSPAVGGFPGWFQDKTGLAMEFCAPSTQAELDGGWCLLLPGDANIPESFPANFFDEHFYWAAGNTLVDDVRGVRANLTLALESAFANGAAAPGDQMVFGRLRVVVPSLPFSGNYRVITPYSDVTYANLQAGDKIFDTLDIGTGCIGTFECALNSTIGPFLLPSPVAGGAEVPPMPDLMAAPPGTDPFYDAMVAAGGGPAPNPGTGKKYVADPGRVGPVTGSPLANFTDSTGASRNHNTFRIEVSDASGQVFYTLDGENNFSLMGRLLAGNIAGNVSSARATYRADASGSVTALDVFAKASPTTQARVPGQPQVPAVMPVLNFYGQACAGALTVDPATGATSVNPGPYTAPAGTANPMATTGGDFWGQTQPGGTPPSHVCIEDTTARNAAGQIQPSYHLRSVTDDVFIATASYSGQANGTLTINAVSSDPTAVLTLAGYGPAAAATPGASAGIGAGTGLELAGNAATVTGLLAPPSQVQVVSSKGGAHLRHTETGQGGAVIVGVPTAVADSATLDEDCSPTSAGACPAGQGVTIDLLANDTVLLNGAITTVRNAVASGAATVTVTATAPRLGTATVSADGILSYTPNANVNGADAVTYTVALNGTVSNQAVAAINITPVNDAPVAGNVSYGAVVSKLNMINLVGTSTDPDGNGDVKNAVITSWPAALGAQPVPVNGMVAFTPTATGIHTIGYQVMDVAGLGSGNSGVGTVEVLLNEIIAFDKRQYVTSKNRWVVSGTDNVRQDQTITIVYENGQLRNAAAPCDGTAGNADCLVGTAVVNSAGNWGIDKVGTGRLNPRDPAVWLVQPTHIRAFSTLPSLGGTAAIDIVFK
jgi:hypothetical protein